MLKSYSEFKRFLLKSTGSLSEHERRLANLILSGFAEISASGSAGGKRGKVLARLINEKGDAASSELKIETVVVSANENAIIRLDRIIVEHFRGFSEKQIFEFKKPYTFVYGPNGTGKYSLCEALEYGLLGTIHESESKRIPVSDYISSSN